MNRKEKQRFEGLLLFTSGAWNTFENWTKVLVPFLMWNLNPKPELEQMIYIQAFSAMCNFLGIFLIAYLIENQGLRRTGIFCAILTTIYQANVHNTRDYFLFHMLQVLLIANHMPMVIDSCIAYIEGEDGDDKKRARMLNRLTIPISFGIAAGPYLALQVMFFLTSSLDYSQMMCAFLHAVCMLPAVFLLPNNKKAAQYDPELVNSYMNLVKLEKTKYCLLLLLLVLGPYAAYDQVIRILMTGTVIREPQQLSRLFFVLGGTTIGVNLFLLPFLQKKYGPRQILYGSFALLALSYLYLAHTTEYSTLLVGMPLQVIGVSLCMGELPSQILASAGKSNAGKAAALIRIAHMLGYLMTPIITGLTVDHDETTILCYFSAVVSLAAMGLAGMDRKQKVMAVLCLIFGLWHLGTQWTTTLLSFLQWDTTEVMTIVDLGYIQAFGSLCNAFGALAIGQMADSTGPKTMFMVSCVLTAIYYAGISVAKTWYAFFFLQILRIGYQLDGTAEMYLATVTTERERTGALMRLSVPQAIAMFFGPIIGSKIAAWTTLRISQFICGATLLVTLMPVLMFMLPTTHSIPKLATARLRPQDFIPMITRNSALREGLVLRALIVAAYVCYEMISRNFILRHYMRDSNDSAIVLMTMAAALLVVQFLILPVLQRSISPKALLQFALVTLIASYISVAWVDSLYQMLIITAVQTGSYAIAYAESSTQITSAVEVTDLGKATGLASMAQWMTHFILPIYASHIVQHYHYTYAFYTSAALSIFSLVYVSIFAKNTNARLGNLLPSLTVTY